MNNISYDGNWDFTDLKYIDLEDKDIAKYTVLPGDILFNRTNSKELVGKTAVFPANHSSMAFAGYLVRLRTNENALPEYVSAFLNSSYGKSILRHMCKSIIGMANINAQELQEIKILLPPVSLQKKFASFVAEVEHQRESMRSALTASEQLFASLSQRAFHGEL
jgi:type I restriction enzyme S subunit